MFKTIEELKNEVLPILGILLRADRSNRKLAVLCEIINEAKDLPNVKELQIEIKASCELYNIDGIKDVITKHCFPISLSDSYLNKMIENLKTQQWVRLEHFQKGTREWAYNLINVLHSADPFACFNLRLSEVI